MGQLFETVIARTTELVYVDPEYETVEETVCTTVPEDPPGEDNPPPSDGTEPGSGPYNCLATVTLLVDDPSTGASAGQTVTVSCAYADALREAGLAT